MYDRNIFHGRDEYVLGDAPWYETWVGLGCVPTFASMWQLYGRVELESHPFGRRFGMTQKLLPLRLFSVTLVWLYVVAMPLYYYIYIYIYSSVFVRWTPTFIPPMGFVGWGSKHPTSSLSTCLRGRGAGCPQHKKVTTVQSVPKWLTSIYMTVLVLWYIGVEASYPHHNMNCYVCMVSRVWYYHIDSKCCHFSPPPPPPPIT